MKVLRVRNVSEALPRAIRLLRQEGQERSSRNGSVLLTPYSVVTVYNKPLERVLFYPARDANPFFHLYEALWMLQGRNDLAPLVKYAKNIANYSDDGVTLHGAYGYRWRHHFGLDQFARIATNLRLNADDRRAVLDMWDPHADGGVGKDFPCNLTATFQRDAKGRLDMTVFCRSNDIIWGCYGANAVHFSMLQEYLATYIGCPVGIYQQVSVNWHAYVEVFKKVQSIEQVIDSMGYIPEPYNQVRVVPMMEDPLGLTHWIGTLMSHADTNTMHRMPVSGDPWVDMVRAMFFAHEIYRGPDADRHALAAEVLKPYQETDWGAAGTEWLLRRKQAHDKWPQMDA